MENKVKITFGKYKNQYVEDIYNKDIYYIEWIIKNIDRKNNKEIFEEIYKLKINNKKEYEFTFGKYKNKKITDVIKNDKEYIKWIIKNSTMNENIKAIIKNEYEEYKDIKKQEQRKINHDNNIGECSICLETMLKPIKLTCNHEYCYKCIIKCDDSKCALCRKLFIKNDVKTQHREKYDENYKKMMLEQEKRKIKIENERCENKLKGIGDCKICEKTMYEPITLKCNHEFCYGCLNGNTCEICNEKYEHTSVWFRYREKYQHKFGRSVNYD